MLRTRWPAPGESFFARYDNLAPKYVPWSTSTHVEGGCEGCHVPPRIVCHKWTDDWCVDSHARRPESHDTKWRETHGEAIEVHRSCEACHEQAFCVKCHVDPHPWYAYPAAFLDRASLVARDVSLHLSGSYEDPVDNRRPSTQPMPDAVCLRCHDPNRKATSGYRILIDHPEHAKRNGSCVSCHVRTAHPVETQGAALSLMSQCFTCHGTEKFPKASAKCATCHPDTYELTPASHKVEPWGNQHGETALQDLDQCRMCHTQESCSGCHGVQMPHPEDWKKGATGHAIVAKINRDVCTKCHTEKPDMCSMCHHKSYDPLKGNWVKQHYWQVEKEGSAFCMKCHQPTFCVRCHATVGSSRAPESSGP